MKKNCSFSKSAFHIYTRSCSPVGRPSLLPPKIARSGDIQMKISASWLIIWLRQIFWIFSPRWIFPYRCLYAFQHDNAWDILSHWPPKYHSQRILCTAEEYHDFILEYQYQEIPRGRFSWRENLRRILSQWRNFWIAKDLWWWLLWTYWNSSVGNIFENVISLNSNLIHSASVIALTLGRMNILS